MDGEEPRSADPYGRVLPMSYNSMSSSSNSTGSIMIKDTIITRTRQIFSSSASNISPGSPHHRRSSNSRASGQENMTTPRRTAMYNSNVFQSGNIARTPLSQGTTPPSGYGNVTPGPHTMMHDHRSRSSSRNTAGLNSLSPDMPHTITIQEMNDDEDDDVQSTASGPISNPRNRRNDRDDSSVASYASGPRNVSRPSHRLDRAHQASSRRTSNNRFHYMPKIRAGRVVPRTRPGAKALLEIRKLRKTTHNLIQKLPFQRVVREVVDDICPGTYRFTAEALAALQEVSEQFLVTMFEDSNKAAEHAKRKTVMKQDIQLVRYMQRW